MSGSSTTTLTSRPRQYAAFTLVEMLVVTSIIVLLLVVTLPALRGLNQSEGRRGAVGNLMAVLDRARMTAISDGNATYVVFACPAAASQVNPDLLGRAYAIFEDADNISFTPVQKTPWMQLPKGMSFKVKPVSTDTGLPNDCITARFATQSPTSQDILFPLATAALPSGSASGTAVQLPYWKFDGTGTVTEQTYLRLLMFPGLVDANDNEISTQNIGTTNAKKNVQLEEIDVNQATGRAKYIIDPSNNLSTPSPTQSP